MRITDDETSVPTTFENAHGIDLNPNREGSCSCPFTVTLLDGDIELRTASVVYLLAF